MSVIPPKLPVRVWVGVSPDKEVNAAWASVWACCAAASSMWMLPVTVPGGKPVTEEPGLRATFPVMTLGPVLVIVWELMTVKSSADPREISCPFAPVETVNKIEIAIAGAT